MTQLSVAVRRQGAGYAVEGAGFYAWEEDRQSLLSWASALRSVAGPGAAAARPPARADAEDTSADGVGARLGEGAVTRF
ncbi:MAG TPA: hypothetical protein VMW35_07150 [Myxococcota bacterium]|jgi:hypothetical protein|nr:hypothetical protein [Myxococcota bacterium]